MNTPCSDDSIFQPGTAVENCKIVRSTTFIVAVLVVCVLVALVVFFLLKQYVKKTGEDEGVNRSEDEMIEGNELNEIEIGEIKGHKLTQIQIEEIEGHEYSV